MVSTAEPSTLSVLVPEPTTLSTLLEQDWAPLYLANAILCSGSKQGNAAAQAGNPSLRDAIQQCLAFAAVCQASRVIRLLPPRHLNDAVFRSDASRYTAFEWQSLSVRPGDLRLAAAVVQCEWKDQGWGNRKGMLSVVKDGGRAPNDYAAWGSDVIVGCEPAPHNYEKLDLCFRPADDAVRYQLFARAGGGGGHSLFVRKVQVRDLAIVDSEAALERYKQYVREMQHSAAPGGSGGFLSAPGGMNLNSDSEEGEEGEESEEDEETEEFESDQGDESE